jgi:hypothetical protein
MPLDPRWVGPPEIVALIFEGGPGPASTVANTAVWVAETTSHEVSMGMSAASTAATMTQWQGVGAVSSTAAVTGLNAGLQALAAWVQEKIPLTTSAAEAFATAASSVIPSVVSQTNRDAWASDNAINPAVFGALTPAIVALDTEYFGEHWPHNNSVGLAYSATLAALTAALALPPPIAPMGASPAAPAAAAEAVAQTAATSAAGDAMRESAQVAQTGGQGAAAPAQAAGQAGQMSSMMEPMQAAMGAMQPLMGMFQAPMQALQGLTSLPQSMMSSMGGMFGNSMKPTDAAMEAVSEPLKAGGGAAGGLGGFGGGGGGGGVGGGLPASGLTSYTRPTSSFAPENAGRPTGLKSGLLNAGEVRGPTTSPPGGTAMPMSAAGAGMLGHGKGDGQKDDVTHARIVVDGDPLQDARRS